MLAFLLLPTARAQDAEEVGVRPEAFAGAAFASAVDLAVVTPALVPVPGLFDLSIVEGRGTYESSNQEGRASLFFPGNGVISGPSLLCGTFLGPSIPPEGAALFGPILDACGQYRYPLAVYVDELVPDASTDGQLALGAASDPVSFRAVGASAHAGDDGTWTRAQVSDVQALGVPVLGSLAPLVQLLGLDPLDGSLLTIDGVTARTDQKIVGGRLSVVADTKVTGLRLLGGLVRIGSISSRSSVLTAAPGGEPEVSSELEVSGVTVAGVPAQITEKGLVVADPGTATGPIVQTLASAAAEALQDVGFRVQSLEVEQGEEGGIPFALAQGLLIEFTTPLADLPPIPGPLGDIDVNGAYGVRLQLGTSGARGFADSFDDETSGSTDTGGDGFVSPPFDDGGTAFPDLGSPGAPSGGSTPPSSPGPGVQRSISDSWGDRLELLYLSFTLGALALCLTPRLTLPARFPGARS
jgi:hypothetical protein